MARAILLCLLLLLLPLPAAAASAVVESLSHVDRSGRWRAVEQSDQGSVLRPTGEDLLRKGATLQTGDRLVTRAARVQLRLSDGSVLNVSEDSELSLEQQADESSFSRLRQSAGQVWYRMRNALVVEHGAVETIVEGTRFLVRQGAEGARVQVEEGQVRTAGQALGRRQQLVLDPSGAGQVSRWTPKAADFASTWALGRPRWQLGLLLSPQLRSGDELAGGGGLRVVAGLHLPADLRLQLSGGMNALTGPSLQVPLGVGLAWQPGAFSLGGELATALERCSNACGDPLVQLHLGGAGFVRYAHTLSRRLSLLGEVRGGYVGGLVVEPGLGLELGL